MTTPEADQPVPDGEAVGIDELATAALAAIAQLYEDALAAIAAIAEAPKVASDVARADSDTGARPAPGQEAMVVVASGRPLLTPRATTAA